MSEGLGTALARRGGGWPSVGDRAIATRLGARGPARTVLRPTLRAVETLAFRRREQGGEPLPLALPATVVPPGAPAPSAAAFIPADGVVPGVAGRAATITSAPERAPDDRPAHAALASPPPRLLGMWRRRTARAIPEPDASVGPTAAGRPVRAVTSSDAPAPDGETPGYGELHAYGAQAPARVRRPAVAHPRPEVAPATVAVAYRPHSWPAKRAPAPSQPLHAGVSQPSLAQPAPAMPLRTPSASPGRVAGPAAPPDAPSTERAPSRREPPLSVELPTVQARRPPAAAGVDLARVTDDVYRLIVRRLEDERRRRGR